MTNARPEFFWHAGHELYQRARIEIIWRVKEWRTDRLDQQNLDVEFMQYPKEKQTVGPKLAEISQKKSQSCQTSDG